MDDGRAHSLPSNVGILSRFVAHGKPYVTDRRAAIRADLVTTADAPTDVLTPIDWPIPSAKPPLTEALLGPQYVCWLVEDCGMTICAEPDRALTERQHLYLGDEHVGWVMPCSDDPTAKWPLGHMRLADMDRVRALAADLPPALPIPAPRWVVAATLLRTAPRIVAEFDR
jgi:hypothetical protein